MQGKRKYLSEFAVNLCSSRWLMVPSNQIGSSETMGAMEQEISDNCHIYLICRHPAASYVEKAFRYVNGHIEGAVTYRIKGVSKQVDFRIEFPLLDGAIEVRLSEYPHREIHTFDSSGEIIRYLPASVICFGVEARRQSVDIGNFEVLYVGQAFADGKRSAFARLKSHSTLQKILADANYNSPDSEIFLLMFEYEHYRVINQMDGRAKDTIDDDRDSERFYSILENPLTEGQQVCLTEAALIRYFSPKYNEIYKESFPSPTHKILQQCYGLDFSALIVEINTDELDFSLYSERIAKNSHHICQIDLLGHEDRKGFFYFSDGADSFMKMSDVIA
jgi:hypothetical protein